MKKLTIPFSGITRNTDDAICKDGETMELINARIKNGSVEPVGMPIKQKEIRLLLTAAYYHSNNGYSNLIGISDKRHLYWIADTNIPLRQFSEDLIDLLGIGNTLVVTTANNKYFFLFKNGGYVYLGDQIPFPEINFRLKPTGEAAIIKTNNYADITVSGGQAIGLGFNGFDEQRTKEFSNSVNGTFLKLLSEAKDKGGFTSSFFVRYAIRLYDNTYIMHSQPLFLPMTTAPFLVYNQSGDWQDMTHLTGIRYDARANIIGLYYTLKGIPDYTNWKDLILSIDVFISRPIEHIDFNEDIKGFYCSGDISNREAYFVLNDIPQAEQTQKMNDTSQFFLLHSFDIENIKNGDWIKGSPKSLDNLELKDRLPDDDFTHNKTGGKMFSYNSRIHLFDISTELFEGFDIHNWLIVDNGSIGTLSEMLITSGEIWVYLNTEDGQKIVRKTFKYIGTVYGIQPFLSYPDKRAYRMVIYLASYTGVTGKPYFCVDLTLKQHSFLNIGYYNHGYPFSKTSSIFTTVASLPSPTLVSNVERAANKLKVSQVNNPFLFPNATTYQPCLGTITALATNTQAVSSGQFGHYPLYVFGSDGIYAMQIGGGNVLYSNTTPISRDVLLNRDALSSTNNSILFATEQGVMVLNGSNTSVVSEAMHGYIPSTFNSTPLFQKILAVPQLDGYITTTEFYYYLEESKFGYNYGENELVISNNKYNYSYVYSLSSGQWYKLSRSFDIFPNSYPSSMAIKVGSMTTQLYNLHNRHRSTTEIAILTRPIKLGSSTHKRILQSAIRGIVHEAAGDLYFRGEPIKFREEGVQLFSGCGFYVLGSNDMEKYILLSGAENLTNIRDLITKMNKTPACKSFVIAFVGGVRTDVKFNYIELLADEAFENRLR